MLDDPKIGTLPDWAYRRWIEFLLLAKEYDHDGLLQPVGDMAWRLRLPVETVSEALRALERVGVARESSDGWLIVNFAKRQAALPSKDRSEKFRAKHRGVLAVQEISDETRAIDIYSKLPQAAGVYSIRTPSGKKYIGASKNVQTRIRQHLTDGRSLKDHFLFGDVKEHGIGALAITILETTDDLSELANMEIKWQDYYREEDSLNKEPGKRNHTWITNETGGIRSEKPNDTQTLRSQRKRSEEESEEEAEQINAGAAGKILPGQRSSYQEWPAIPNAQTAEKVFQQVTGMTTFPGRARDNDIERICALYDRHHEQTPAYLNTYWQAWLQRGYNRVNTGWLDWAVSGQIPRWRGNGNGNGAGPPGIDPAIGTDDPSVVSAFKYLKNNPHGGGREDALERLKSKGFDYDSEQQKLRPISGK